MCLNMLNLQNAFREQACKYIITASSSVGKAPCWQLQFQVTNSKIDALYRTLTLGKPSDFTYSAPFF